MTSGTLNVTAGPGVSGNGTAAVTITRHGGRDQRGARRARLLGNLNFHGADTLTVTTGDGTAQDTDTVAITVNAVNDAPVNTVPAAQSVNEDTVLPIAGMSVADVDGAHTHHHADGDERDAERDGGSGQSPATAPQP